MKYTIKSIEDEENKWERIFLILIIMIYFLCLIISDIYSDYNFAEWVFTQYKKLPY